MKIALQAERALDAARAETGKALPDWFAELDARGGPALGRREIGNYLHETHRLDPWWIATINIEYEAAHGLKEKDGRAKGYTICATKSIKAAPQRCFDAFASAAALDRWLGAGHALSFEEGGRLNNADGNAATIRKIAPGKSIRLQWQQTDAASDTPVEIKFQPAGAKTTVMVTHDRLQTRAEADGLRAAWGEALERLKPILEAADP